MLVGILSDSHGRFEATKAAIALLLERGAKHLLHCGDVGDERIIDLLAGDVPAGFVFGNNDYDRDDLAAYARSLGVTCFGTLGEITIDGKRFAITHGDIGSIVRRILAGAETDYLLVGHSHVVDDRRQDTTRIINPGALHRAAVKTVALLDTATDRLEFLPLAGF